MNLDCLILTITVALSRLAIVTEQTVSLSKIENGQNLTLFATCRFSRQTDKLNERICWNMDNEFLTCNKYIPWDSLTSQPHNHLQFSVSETTFPLSGNVTAWIESVFSKEFFVPLHDSTHTITCALIDMESLTTSDNNTFSFPYNSDDVSTLPEEPTQRPTSIHDIPGNTLTAPAAGITRTSVRSPTTANNSSGNDGDEPHSGVTWKPWKVVLITAPVSVLIWEILRRLCALTIVQKIVQRIKRKSPSEANGHGVVYTVMQKIRGS